MRVIDDRYLDQYRLEIGNQIKGWFESYDFSDEKVDLGYNIRISIWA